MVQLVVHFVFTVTATQVPGQVAGDFAASAKDELHVRDIGAKDGAVTTRKLAVNRVAKHIATGTVAVGGQVVVGVQAITDDGVDQVGRRNIGLAVAIRVDLQCAFCRNCNITIPWQHRWPVDETALGFLVHVARMAEQLEGVGDVIASVGKELVGLDVRVTPALPEAVVGHLTLTHDIRHYFSIGPGITTTGSIRVGVFTGQVQKTVTKE